MTVRGYAICGTPRIGGHYLCGLLHRAGYGRPAEYLSPVIAAGLMRRHGLTPGNAARYQRWLLRHRAPRGWFGVLVHWDEVAYDWLAGPFDGFLPGEPRWVMLTRDDVDAQARSWAVALATGEWFGRSAPHPEVVIDAATLAEYRDRIRGWNRAWDAWFTHRRLDRLDVTYEAVCADPSGAVAEITGWLDAA